LRGKFEFIIDKKDLKKFNVVIYNCDDDEVLNFGKLKNLI